ncbi:MAG: hypothetical protein R3C56_21585 [Pirellulaceae bacterium]
MPPANSDGWERPSTTPTVLRTSVLQTGSPESEVLDISFFAGRSQLREFRGRNR